MEQLDYATFLQQRNAFDQAVAGESEIAHFCSSSIWQVAASNHLHSRSAEENYLICRDDDHWLVLVEQEADHFFPLEAAWMFGQPLIGGNGESKLDFLFQVVREVQGRPTAIVIPGILREGELHRALEQRADSLGHYHEFEATDCMTVDLTNGVDSWLERRSKKFRKSMRQIKVPDGFEIKSVESESPENLFERILAIQRRTYKWREGTDIFQAGSYDGFYTELLTELHRRGDLRMLVGQVNGNDVAHIFGGVSGQVYRGFQMSYAEEFRSFGIGNALQLENMRRSEKEGITHYDLGMHSEYKERWADEREEYLGVFAVVVP